MILVEDNRSYEVRRFEEHLRQQDEAAGPRPGHESNHDRRQKRQRTHHRQRTARRDEKLQDQEDQAQE